MASDRMLVVAGIDADGNVIGIIQPTGG